jgi:hypothetical protein
LLGHEAFRLARDEGLNNWPLRYCNSISFAILSAGKCKVGHTFKLGRMIWRLNICKEICKKPYTFLFL